MVKTNKYREHLIIPDSHAKPGVDNDRFSWLGEFALEHKPDVIVDIGDSADMASLCKYDTGSVVAEGRRYSMHSFRVGGAVSQALASTAIDALMGFVGWKTRGVAHRYVGPRPSASDVPDQVGEPRRLDRCHGRAVMATRFFLVADEPIFHGSSSPARPRPRR